MSIIHLDQEEIKSLKFDVHDRAPIFFDIETGPTDDVHLIKPSFTAPSNWKDPAKIERYIVEKEGEWLDKAALNPLSGEIVAFGFRFKGVSYSLLSGGTPPPEALLLMGITELSQRAGQRTWVGHNSKDFDLPFICRRMFKHGFKIPGGWRSDRYWAPWFEDTKDMWTFGKYGEFISLDRLAKFFGHIGKQDASGKDFHLNLKYGDANEAYDYLANDLELTEYVYNRLKHAD